MKERGKLPLRRSEADVRGRGAAGSGQIHRAEGESVQQATLCDVYEQVVGCEKVGSEEWPTDVCNDECPLVRVSIEAEQEFSGPIAANCRAISSSESDGRVSVIDARSVG